MSAETNRALIEKLYGAMDRCDGDEMTACYAPDARFSDPAFGELKGPEVGAMWRMLTSRATDLSVELRAHDADETTGTANWVATYSFGATGRHVVNDINARYRFADGLIAEHDDDFDFGRWARQALGGLKGTLVGLLPPLRKKAHEQARAQLDEFMKSEAAGKPAEAAGTDRAAEATS